MDLSEVLPPIPYEDIAPKDYRKLNNLHNKTGTESHVPTLRNVKPTAAYSGSDLPYSSFMQSSQQQPVAPMYSVAGRASITPDPDPLDFGAHQHSFASMNTDSGVALGGFDRVQESNAGALFAGSPEDYYGEGSSSLVDGGNAPLESSNDVAGLIDDDSFFGGSRGHDKNRRNDGQFGEADILPSSFGDAGSRKRKLEDAVISDKRDHKKADSHGSNVNARADEKLVGEANGSGEPPGEQQQSPVKNRPAWLDEFDPDFVAMFDFVEFAD